MSITLNKLIIVNIALPFVFSKVHLALVSQCLQRRKYYLILQYTKFKAFPKSVKMFVAMSTRNPEDIKLKLATTDKIGNTDFWPLITKAKFGLENASFHLQVSHINVKFYHELLIIPIDQSQKTVTQWPRQKCSKSSEKAVNFFLLLLLLFFLKIFVRIFF